MARGARFTMFAGICSGTALLLAVAVLVGWQFGIEVFTSLAPGSTSVNPAAAIGIVALSIGLMLKRAELTVGWSRWFANLAAALTIVAGFWRLADLPVVPGVPIDLVLYAGPWQTLKLSRIAPQTAACLIMLGAAVLTLDRQTRRGIRPAQILALLVGAVTLCALLGYAFGSEALYGFARFRMPFLTAVAMLLLGLALLFIRPHAGLMSIVTGSSDGGLLARRVLPAVLVLPPLLGYLRISGERAELFDGSFGTAMFVVSLMGLLAVLVGHCAASLHRADQRRHAIEDSLRTSEERFALAVRGSSDGLWDWDLVTNAVWYEPRYRELLGYSEQEFPNAFDSWERHVHPDDKQRVLEAVERHIQAHTTFDVEQRLRTKTDEYRWFRTRGAVARNADGRAVRMAGSIRDITDLKVAEYRLATHEAETRTILNSTADAIIAIDDDGLVTMTNEAAWRMFGYAPGAMTGLRIGSLVPALEYANRTAGSKHGFAAIPSRIGEAERESEAVRKDGARRLVSLRLRAMQRHAALGATGSGYVAVLHDITIRKQLEAARDALMAKAQESARELARSNHDLEEFAYVASHDLRAPLRAIRNLAGWLEEDLGANLNGENRERMDLLKSRVARLEQLIDDLLNYSRAGRVLGAIRKVQSRELVNDIIELLSPPPGFEVINQVNLPQFETAVAPFEQVLRNLLNNALKHHDRPAGRIEVGGVEKDGSLEFWVTDDGPGIPPEFHERVFQLFETLKPRDTLEGSGMGLAVVKRTVEKLGGTIQIECGSPRGTTFRFTWPRSVAHRTPLDLPENAEPTRSAEISQDVAEFSIA